MTVREQLKTEDPFLHEALERSWSIAHETWLPTLGTDLGSHNAYPHLHNMELRLNDLMEAFGGDDRQPSFRLSAAEKYLLLAAILFHDIGRGSEEHRKDHARGSYRLLKDYWAEYGIPSSALAYIVAKLAWHHDPPKNKEPGPDRKREPAPADLGPPLSERTVDPYGRVRERGLLAVLILLDHLDTSYMRTVPHEFGVKAKSFRTRVQGVEVDAGTRLICSVLAASDLEGFVHDDLVDEHRGAKDPPQEPKLEYYVFGNDPADKGKRDLIREVASGQRKLRFPGKYRPQEHEKLAVVLSDLQKHAGELDRIRPNLHSMGITLGAWLLELDEHLFDSAGCEFWEPIFDLSYLRRVASEMWKLSGQVFGRSLFSYDTLAAAVREPDVSRVRRAVKRLSILTDDLPLKRCGSDQFRTRGPLEAHDLWWKWRVEGDSMEDCSCVRLEEVELRLKTLEEQRAKEKQRLEELTAPLAGGTL